MLTLKEAKDFLRVDDDSEDALIASLITTAKVLTEDILREELDLESDLPEPITQAMLIIVATLFEERQVSKDKKDGLSIEETLDTVRRMLFSYRKECF